MPRRSEAPQRLLTTVLFTDIVGSTDKAVEVGDKRWRQIVSAHHTLVRRQLKRFQGREVDTAGDGFFATFDQPAQAIRCAEAVVRDVRRLGIEVRAGVHMGEVEVIGPKVGGIAVHIGARVMSKAGPGEVLVSSTVRDLVAGSDMRFEDLGSHELKGVPAQWRLYAVKPADDALEEAPPIVEEERRRSPLPWIAAVVAVLLIAALIGVVLTARRGKGGLPGPAPNTAVRIDPSSEKVNGGIAVGRRPGAIAADGTTIWVANFDDGTVQAIDARSNTASPAIALGFSAAPNGIAVGGGFVWVISSTSGTLYRIDPSQAHDISPIPVPTGVSGVAFGEGAVWISSNFDDRVLRIDPQNPRGTPGLVQLETGAGPKGIAVGAGAVWVAEGLKGKVARIDPSAMKVTSTVPLLAGNPNHLAFGEGYVWATDTEDDSVTRIDPTGTPQGTTISRVGNAPDGVAAGDGAAWVASGGDGTVARIDPKTSNVTHISIDSNLSPEGVAVTNGAVWVTVHSK
jgi:class 3 adenylate cyclase/DNA-binding beta-propeller fold protein YncE